MGSSFGPCSRSSTSLGPRLIQMVTFGRLVLCYLAFGTCPPLASAVEMRSEDDCRDDIENQMVALAQKNHDDSIADMLIHYDKVEQGGDGDGKVTEVELKLAMI